MVVSRLAHPPRRLPPPTRVLLGQFILGKKERDTEASRRCWAGEPCRRLLQRQKDPQAFEAAFVLVGGADGDAQVVRQAADRAHDRAAFLEEDKRLRDINWVDGQIDDAKRFDSKEVKDLQYVRDTSFDRPEP